MLVELTEAVAKAEAEREAPAPDPEVAVEQDRPALAEGLDLTAEELAEARRQEEESREFEAIQAALDSSETQLEPGPKSGGTGDVGDPKKTMLGM